MGHAGPRGLPDGGPVPPPELGVGDRATDTSWAARKRVFAELVGLWLVSLLLIRGVVWISGVVPAVGIGDLVTLPEVVLAGVPVLFIYTPVLLCRLRKVDSYGYRLSVPPFRDWRGWGTSLGTALKWSAVFLLPYVPLYHFWQRAWEHAPGDGVFPPDFGTLVLYQVFFVAIPEEFFYRGYLQTRLNEVFDRRFLLFGIPFGHSLWITSILFAFGHSIVVLQWWHFAIFLPGLLFGLLREKTGSVLPGAIFHAFCNILVVTLDTWYGVIPVE